MSNESAKKNESGSNKFVLGLAALIALLLIVWLAQKRTATPKPEETAAATDTKVDATSTRNVNRPPPAVPEASTNAEPEEPKENGPRAYLVEDFTDAAKTYENYKFNNVQVTPQGLTLAPGAESGTFESPPLVLKMPSSMAAVLWKQEVPKGASVKMECRVSGDNQSWSDWYPVEDTGDDISPIYPDGTPNPNYGYVPGSYVNLGLDKAPFVQYKGELASSGGTQDYRRPDGTFAEALRISKIRVYHGDFSGPEGRMATAESYPPGPGKPQPGEIPNPADPPPTQTQ